VSSPARCSSFFPMSSTLTWAVVVLLVQSEHSTNWCDHRPDVSVHRLRYWEQPRETSGAGSSSRKCAWMTRLRGLSAAAVERRWPLRSCARTYRICACSRLWRKPTRAPIAETPRR